MDEQAFRCFLGRFTMFCLVHGCIIRKWATGHIQIKALQNLQTETTQSPKNYIYNNHAIKNTF